MVQLMAQARVSFLGAGDGPSPSSPPPQNSQQILTTRPSSGHKNSRGTSHSNYLSERLDLDNRHLEKIPDLMSVLIYFILNYIFWNICACCSIKKSIKKFFSGYEEILKLLNLQHNSIVSLNGIQILKRLVFLDLYDNKITDIRPG